LAKGGRMRSTQRDEKPVTKDDVKTIVREIIREEVPNIVQEVVQKTIARFWEHTMLPYMNTTFATKVELKESFELYDIKMEKRFVEINSRFGSIEARLGRVEVQLISMREDIHEIRQSTTSRLDAHTTQIRQIHGVSDVDQGEEYLAEKSEK